MNDDSYTFTAELWRYPGPEAWYFITVPTAISEELEARYGKQKRAWASLPVRVTIGATTWETSLFSDKKRNAFLLPVKAQVRKQAHLEDGSMVDVTLSVRLS